MYHNPRERTIINEAIHKSNTMFNPSFNQHTEALSSEPNDRDAYDFAGCELETNHE